MIEIFSERLKELRKERNISAKQLSKAINVSDAAIIRWENKQRIPSMENIYKIAIYFGVSADYLLGLKDY
ncbi:MAG: helix-turn-helix transcriptional regulator [Clostridia bacterium]|nr:helix-turn-helix transcriptional regulator [Clostridia bacterium]